MKELLHTFYISKYALSEGIQEVMAEDPSAVNSPDVLRVGLKSGWGGTQYFYKEGRDWHRTREAAVARAEEMRIAKLKSLDKQMKKIAARKF